LNCQCVDFKNTSWCEKKKNQGKCHWFWVKKNCQKTCEYC
jgi:hypothetical protein